MVIAEDGEPLCIWGLSRCIVVRQSPQIPLFLELVPTVYNDNLGASTLAEYPDFHRRTKHIRRRHHFATECVEEGDIIVAWIRGESNPADMLSKPVTRMRFTALKRLIGMNSGRLGSPLPW